MHRHRQAKLIANLSTTFSQKYKYKSLAKSSITCLEVPIAASPHKKDQKASYLKMVEDNGIMKEARQGPHRIANQGLGDCPGSGVWQCPLSQKKTYGKWHR